MTSDGETNPDDDREAQPTPPDERIVALDVIRGVALLGILLVNIHYFYGLDLDERAVGDEIDGRSTLDAVVEVATGSLVSGTFLGLFSLLFGIGLAIQLGRSRTGRLGSQRVVVATRMFWLGLIGVGHMQFVTTDILVPYAASGLLLVVVAGPTLPPRRVWLRILGAVGLGLFVVGLVAANLESVAILEFFFEEGRSEAAREALVGAAFVERLDIRAMETFSYYGRFYLLSIVGWNLIGFWLGFSPILEWLQGNAKEWLVVGGLATAIGAALRLGMGIPTDDVGPYLAPEGIGGVMTVVGSLFLVAGTGAVIGGLANWATERGWTPRRLAAIGRMALTAYLLQSVISLLLLSIPGVREWMGAANSLIAVVGIWGLLLVVCPWWMKHFRFGPVEWLWRVATYLRIQPIRKG